MDQKRVPIVVMGSFDNPTGMAELSNELEELILSNDRLGVSYVKTHDELVALNIFPFVETPKAKQPTARNPVAGHNMAVNGYVARIFITCECGEELPLVGVHSIDTILAYEALHWENVIEEKKRRALS